LATPVSVAGVVGQGRGKAGGSWEHDVPNEIWSRAGMSKGCWPAPWEQVLFPTKSMMGTTIAEDNQESFRVIDDPFGSGKQIGIIKALNPDLTIIHGWAADRYGNTILCQGNSIVDEWSALASKNEIVGHRGKNWSRRPTSGNTHRY